MADWVVFTAITILILAAAAATLRKDIVPQGHVGLRYANEVFVASLEPGVYRFFNPLKNSRVVLVSVTPTALSQHQIEVTSDDKFAFRLTLTPLVTVCDAQLFNEGNPHGEAHFGNMANNPEFRLTRVQPVLSSEAIAAVARCDLESFLSDPKAAISKIGPALEAAMPGVKLDDIVISAIIMPPEIRKMFTEIERAKREGLAKLERAKAEQASLRALANAARNMADNPQLAHLRTLQVMENTSGPKTFVLGDVGQAANASNEDG